MDSHNLATLFGPNILHKAKGGAFQVERQERAEERVEVIKVVKEMIDHQHDIFAVCYTTTAYCHNLMFSIFSFSILFYYYSVAFSQLCFYNKDWIELDSTVINDFVMALYQIYDSCSL